MEPDPDSAEWLRVLTARGPERDAGLDQLHELLLRVAHHEIHRRRTPISGPELDDLAFQAAADAMLAILGKIGSFRGESRFTTWAYKFVMFEVSGKLSRHQWRAATPALEAEDWERLPEVLGAGPDHQVESADLVAAVRRAVDETLTEHQRRIFVALALDGEPLDALATELSTNRNAIYKSLFDARRKIRRHLVANGYLDDVTARRS